MKKYLKFIKRKQQKQQQQQLLEQHKIYIFMEISHHHRRGRIFSSHIFFFLAEKKVLISSLKRFSSVISSAIPLVVINSLTMTFMMNNLAYLSRNYLTSCGNGRMDPRSNKILMISAKRKSEEENWISLRMH